MSWKVAFTLLHLILVITVFCYCGFLIIDNSSCKEEMSKKIRVNGTGEEPPATQQDRSDEGSEGGDTGEDLQLRRELKLLHKRVKDLQEKMEVFDMAIHEFDTTKGQRVSIIKKALGMSNFAYAW